MDFGLLSGIAKELKDELQGAIISKIFQPLPREIGLKMFQPGVGEKRLILSADPKFGRIHLTKLRLINPPRPPRFCSYLRAHLTNARISSVDCSLNDRVITLTCDLRSSNLVIVRNLILELLGRDSNIILVDATTSLVMDSLHHIPQKISGNRPVMPGVEYQNPPMNPNQSKFHLMGAKLSESPQIESETVAHQSTVSALKTEGEAKGDKINEAVDDFFSKKLVESLVENRRRQISKPIKARIKSTTNRISKIKSDIEKLELFIEKSKHGELLKTVLKKIVKGQSSIEVPDWETGVPQVIMLDPALDSVANMQKLFEKSAKGKRGLKIAKTRLIEATEEKKSLEETLFFIEQAQSQDDLELLYQELDRSRNSKKTAPVKKIRKKDPDVKISRNYDQYFSPSGYEIIVGKSSRSNDFITRKKARKGDIWFHAKEAPGAHVILMCRESKDMSDLDIRHCARIAARNSKLKDAGKVEVMFTDAVNVTKPRESFPGMVSVKKYQSINVNLDDEDV